MDFSTFEYLEHIPALTWLGKKDWVTIQSTGGRGICLRPKHFIFQKKDEVVETNPHSIVISSKERQQYPHDHWRILQSILDVVQREALGLIWYYTLSKALAGGPKLFRPTADQCLALEHTSATFPFDMYRQPYPVIILEMPKEYCTRLAEKFELKDYNDKERIFVFVSYDEANKFIAQSAFFTRTNIITNLMLPREEYETVEDAIVKNRQTSRHQDFDAAETVQRLGMNFAMMMTLLGTKVAGRLNSLEYQKDASEAKSRHPGGKFTNKALKAQLKLTASMQLLEFEQNIKFYDEIEEVSEGGTAQDIDQLRRSPKTHWRRGHWRQQVCGVGRMDRKSVFIKPLLVRAAAFIGDVKDASVIYTAKPGRHHDS